jgi:hypothetical protein
MVQIYQHLDAHRYNRLESHNLHHSPHASFTHGILYAPSCSEFSQMKNAVDYICFDDGAYVAFD